MPAKNPRVNVVLEKPLMASVLKAAKRDGVSVSTKMRDLVLEALESSEDLVMGQIAEKRDREFSWDQSLSHEQVFGSTKRKQRT